jgi:hypothetical protein
MRIVARFVLQSLPHELALRLAKRRGLQTAKGNGDWEVAEKARTLYRAANSSDLARLIFEAILIGSAAKVDADKKDDLLTDAATLHKVDAKVLRVAVEKDEKEKAEKKMKAGKKNATRRANRLSGK